METFRALLTVDAEKFSTHRDADLPGVHTEIRDAVERACRDSGLAETWRAVRFLESTGDGLLAALPHEAIPALVHPFPARLQEALADAAPRLRARGLHLRLRAALHFGLVDDERPDAPGISAAVTEVCRLVEAKPLRAALADSHRDVTFVAFLVSAEVFATYVQAGRTGLHASRFTEVAVEVKQFARPAYLHVPVSSARGGGPPAKESSEDAPAPAVPSISGVRISGARAQVAFGNTVRGDLRQDRP
ncbi:hypothetical protein [Actinomadura parmotrematis]|uniref:Uncharacterized protein n=1 Tax=Actinomadura parmotrematis TaxID=2864039 RepID=A0ABS7G038_9ACTN|nr:hypothetical protein [Actinomadura parmotrematis]MBW8486073.1 hypothetical protein [Actinomadura parmotrematis]